MSTGSTVLSAQQWGPVLFTCLYQSSTSNTAPTQPLAESITVRAWSPGCHPVSHACVLCTSSCSCSCIADSGGQSCRHMRSVRPKPTVYKSYAALQSPASLVGPSSVGEAARLLLQTQAQLESQCGACQVVGSIEELYSFANASNAGVRLRVFPLRTQAQLKCQCGACRWWAASKSCTALWTPPMPLWI